MFHITPSFIENLEAGFVTWIADVLILVIFVPFLIRRTENKRWRPMRQIIVNTGVAFVEKMFDELLINSSDPKLYSTDDWMNSLMQACRSDISLFSVAVSPDMAQPLGNFILAQSSLYELYTFIRLFDRRSDKYFSVNFGKILSKSRQMWDVIVTSLDEMNKGGPDTLKKITKLSKDHDFPMLFCMDAAKRSRYSSDIVVRLDMAKEENSPFGVGIP